MINALIAFVGFFFLLGLGVTVRAGLKTYLRMRNFFGKHWPSPRQIGSH